MEGKGNISHFVSFEKCTKAFMGIYLYAMLALILDLNSSHGLNKSFLNLKPKARAQLIQLFIIDIVQVTSDKLIELYWIHAIMFEE